MSKMGNKLEQNLDNAKYDLYEACKKACDAIDNEWLYQTGQFSPFRLNYPSQGSVHGDLIEARKDIEKAIAKVESKDV